MTTTTTPATAAPTALPPKECAAFNALHASDFKGAGLSPASEAASEPGIPAGQSVYSERILLWSVGLSVLARHCSAVADS